MFLDDFQDLFLEVVFYGFQHVVDVCVVEVEGGTVDVDFFYQFFYGDFFDAFVLHEFGEAGAELGFGFSYAAVGFFGHDFGAPFLS